LGIQGTITVFLVIFVILFVVVFFVVFFVPFFTGDCGKSASRSLFWLLSPEMHRKFRNVLFDGFWQQLVGTG
jgi:hypothetical protein